MSTKNVAFVTRQYADPIVTSAGNILIQDYIPTNNTFLETHTPGAPDDERILCETITIGTAPVINPSLTFFDSVLLSNYTIQSVAFVGGRPNDRIPS